MLNVLIIDDDEKSCKDIELSLRKIFDKKEINIYFALDYNQAQKIIYSHCIDINILFVDIVLNQNDVISSGIEIIEEILQFRQDLPFIIISGYYFEKIKEINRKLLGLKQYIGFLDKGDYTDDDILDVVDKALRFIDNFRIENYKSNSDSTEVNKKISFNEFLFLIAKNLSFHEKAISDLDVIYHQDRKLYHSVLDFISNYDRDPKRYASERFAEKFYEIKKEIYNRAIRLFIFPQSPKNIVCRICDHPKSYEPIKNWLKNEFKK